MISNVLNRITSSDEVLAAVIGVLLTGFIAFFIQVFSAKAKIHWAIFNEDNFLLKDHEGKAFQVYTRTLWIRNVGRGIVEDLEVVFNWQPPNLHVFPHLPYSFTENADDRCIVRIANLNPKEFVFLAMLSSVQELPDITNVRFRGGQGTKIAVHPQRQFPMWFNISAFLMMIFGLVAVLYMIIRVLLHFEVFGATT